MTVNDATLVHVGEVRTFGATASQRGAPILSSLCGHFQPQLKVTNMSFPSQMLILVFSVCCMLKRKSDAVEALTVLINYHALHCAPIQDICTGQGDEFKGSNETFSHSGGNGTLQTKDSLDFLLKRVIEDEMLKHILMLAHRLKLHGLAERWKMTVMKRQIPCCSVPVDLISFGRQQLHMLISLATAAHERPQPSHAHELFDHQQPRVVQLCVFGSDCYELLPTHQKVPGQQARKRLIYCGESAERHLSKTLRASASTRSSHTTPGAISSAKVCTRNCPLQADDFTGMSQPLAVRNVFSPNVSSPSQVLESGGAGGEIGMKEGISHMPKSTVNGDGCSSSSEANRQPRNERSPPTASASHRPLQHDGRRTQDQKRKASDTTRTDTSSNLNTRANSAPFRNSASGMGRQAVSHDSTRSCKCEKIPISTPAVEGEGESEPEEEFKINTEWSANPTWQTANASAAAKSSQPKTELFAANIDAAKAREVSSTPLKFHDQIRALWEYDKMIQLSDVDVKQFRDQILHPPSI